ncbi:unnamed protein product [Miscanthus lutarioriparius]|uniref:Tyrosine specific protein phosphatases domain-containing protein n=1 Tax=Miscanthus lutarioriparius TaxID=422564 RepID=A0A811PX14_9POAL|nr:unnamed protein product [Miscanthus lutarioriparius]
MVRGGSRRSNTVKTAPGVSTSGAESSAVEMGTEKSEVYSTNMTQAMGQSPLDVDKLRKIGVKTVFCLQQDSDLEDFDAFDLRLRLPAVVSKLHKLINCNGGVTYIHCTAGLGRAPAVALAYMFWILGYSLNEGHQLLQSKRACFPKLEAIKLATADILTGLSKNTITLKWEDDGCSSVEISGLDISWGSFSVVYILDQVRALENEMVLRLKKQGLDYLYSMLMKKSAAIMLSGKKPVQAAVTLVDFEDVLENNEKSIHNAVAD